MRVFELEEDRIQAIEALTDEVGGLAYSLEEFFKNSLSCSLFETAIKRSAMGEEYAGAANIYVQPLIGGEDSFSGLDFRVRTNVKIWEYVYSCEDGEGSKTLEDFLGKYEEGVNFSVEEVKKAVAAFDLIKENPKYGDDKLTRDALKLINLIIVDLLIEGAFDF
ncbi:hypothetical protein MPG35_06665 [Helicobacter pylori]|uniref:hypothetical protein n=1 Tax=Helicobacter pylori TaxID=210 RepID=UPI001FD433DE|nr:hypothetical protein [Helicobacter pylori]UOS28423.1 hypothetical protein MPG35_06665 [Helicobacter pylori]